MSDICKTCPTPCEVKIGQKPELLQDLGIKAIYRDNSRQIATVDVSGDIVTVWRETGNRYKTCLTPRLKAAMEHLDRALRDSAGIPQQETITPLACPRHQRRAPGSGNGSAGNFLPGAT